MRQLLGQNPFFATGAQIPGLIQDPTLVQIPVLTRAPTQVRIPDRILDLTLVQIPAPGAEKARVVAHGSESFDE